MFTRKWSEKAGTWKLGVLLACAVFALGVGATPAFAVEGVDELGLFELDGNAADDSLVDGDDWESVFNGTYSAAVATGIISDINVYDSQDNVLTGGSSKDEIDVSNWLWKIAKPTPDKDNITNAYAAAYVADNGDLIIYFGADRYANNGDAMIGFWFFQSDISANSSYGFDGNHAEGDILVLTNFTKGGAVDSVLVYEWVESGGDVSEHLRFLAQDGACGKGGQFACAINNPGGEDSIWAYEPKFGPPDIFPSNSFFEGGINVSHYFDGGATPCYTAFLAETRSSQSTDAVLKDFVLASFPLCDITVVKNCIVSGFVKEDDPNYDPDMPFYLDAFVTVTNSGVGALPTGTEVCVEDIPVSTPSYPSSPPETKCVTLDAPLHANGTLAFNFSFMTAANPPDNSAEVTATFDTQELTAYNTTTCGGLDLEPDLYVDKTCTTSLNATAVPGYVVAQVDYTITVCNFGNAPLWIRVEDDTAGVDQTIGPLDYVDWKACDEPADCNGLCTGGYCDNHPEKACTTASDCVYVGTCLKQGEESEGRCVDLPGFVTGGDICQSITGHYLPSEVSSTDPCPANFMNTVTAHGSNEDLGIDEFDEIATATCGLCIPCCPSE